MGRFGKLVGYEKNTVQYSSVTEFVRFVDLKNLRPRTKESYLMHVVGAARHFGCDPALLKERQIGDFLIFLRNERKYAPSSMAQTIVALRTFYRDHLGHAWGLWKTVRVRRVESLPVVMTREEVHAVIQTAQRRLFRTLLRLIYHCGLRLGEAIRLAPRDIDREVCRLHVRHAKGGKARFVPLAPVMIAELDSFYALHNNRLWLFPGLGRGWKSLNGSARDAAARSHCHVSEAAVQVAFKLCVQQSGISKDAVVHTLRHSYATHLMEEGVPIRLISQYLGHASLETTLIYTHLTSISEDQTREVLTKLYAHSARKPGQPQEPKQPAQSA